MPSIKDAVDAIPKKDLVKEAPEKSPGGDVELDQEKVTDMVTRLLEPWKYGRSLQRNAMKAGITLDQAKEIKEVLVNRLREENLPVAKGEIGVKGAKEVK